MKTVLKWACGLLLGAVFWASLGSSIAVQSGAWSGGVVTSAIDLNGVANGIIFDEDADTKAYATTDDSLVFMAGGNTFMTIGPTMHTLSKAINVGNVWLYSSSGPLMLGYSASSSHSLATQDVLVKAALEVDGKAWFDSAVNLGGAATNVGATCTVGDFSIDNSGTWELCYCSATNVHVCTSMAAGPAD